MLNDPMCLSKPKKIWEIFSTRGQPPCVTLPAQFSLRFWVHGIAEGPKGYRSPEFKLFPYLSTSNVKLSSWERGNGVAVAVFEIYSYP